MEIIQRNFSNETCCQTYCPCCPNCDCDCRCTCNCTKKKMIIPTFFFSFICFILILIGMITKSTDTTVYKNFKAIYNNNNNNENYIEKILDIEKNEDNYSLILLVIGGIILLIYLVLMICFLYEKSCFENYNPKCKIPYYLTMMFVNFILNYVNAIMAFVFCGYRSDTINDYSNFFSENKSFKNNNDLNLSLEIIIGIFYLIISILHLFVYYYLFKEDRICLCCCENFLDCMSCCGGCIKCLCCCCCCTDCTEIPPSTVYVQSQQPVQQEVVIVQQNPPMPVNNNVYTNNNNPGIIDRIRNLLPGNVKGKVDRVCNKGIYSNSFAQFVNCIICGNVFQMGQEILILPCGHICHSNCGYNWFENNKNCPSDGILIIN